MFFSFLHILGTLGQSDRIHNQFYVSLTRWRCLSELILELESDPEDWTRKELFGKQFCFQKTKTALFVSMPVMMHDDLPNASCLLQVIQSSHVSCWECRS